ncbi:DMT family transporter [Paenibacillus paeoniae]|uniref:QacE family quaternary ammonium compound efflux SMR transporter n=1 Tax=Paenibacillus paeoniae TaxID=2292705 RepID=A0A371PNC5_9BACL|nr:multidrug efflux SMR transporter [Paenibacillus paeoniae]REK77169.1 QacE family quaternary ammonium compound efflux SMR transporter [Paenibacillus paeoniae]
MNKGYWALSVSILFEVFGTTMLKLSHGFTELLPAIGVVIGFGVAFYSLSICLRTIPLSMAYAIWSGVGTALTALIGVIVWNDPFNLLTLSGFALIVGGVALLHAADNAPKTARGEAV